MRVGAETTKRTGRPGRRSHSFRTVSWRRTTAAWPCSSVHVSQRQVGELVHQCEDNAVESHDPNRQGDSGNVVLNKGSPVDATAFEWFDKDQTDARLGEDPR